MMVNPHPKVHNQISQLIQHNPTFWFKGPQKKLGQMSHLSEGAICRIINGHEEPLVSTALKIAQALSKALGTSITVEDIIALHTFPKGAACQVIGCKGCLFSDRYAPEEICA